MPTTTRYFSWPAFTRALSASGSIRSLSATSSAALISAAVRLRTKMGLPRQTMVMPWPAATGATSNSTLERASTSLAGFMLSMKGQARAPTPMTAPKPVSSFRKSRFPTSAVPTVEMASLTVALAAMVILCCGLCGHMGLGTPIGRCCAP